MGPAQLWKGCPFVGILNLPRQPPQGAPFLLTFCFALIGGRSVTDPCHQELATGAAFVIGMPQSFFLQGGRWDAGMRRGGEKMMQVAYAAFEWLRPDLDKGVQVLQAGFVDSCARQLTLKTQAAPLLPRQAVAYEGVTLLRAMVGRRDGEVVCRVPSCGKTVPPALRNTPAPLVAHFRGNRLCRLSPPRKWGEPEAQPVSCANGFFFVSSACGQPASSLCRHCLLSAPSRGAAGNCGTTCAAIVSSNTRTTSCLTSAPRNWTGARRS